MSGHIRIAAGLEERSQRTFWFHTTVHRLEGRAPNNIQRELYAVIKIQARGMLAVVWGKKKIKKTMQVFHRSSSNIKPLLSSPRNTEVVLL